MLASTEILIIIIVVIIMPPTIKNVGVLELGHEVTVIARLSC